MSINYNPDNGEQLYLNEADQYKLADEKRINVIEASSGKTILIRSSKQRDENLLDGIHLKAGVYIIRVEGRNAVRIFKHVVK